MTARNKIWIAVLLLELLLGFAVVTYVFRTGRPDISRLKTDFRMEAPDLYHQFESDEQAAQDRFAGAILEVTGVLETIEQDQWGNRTLIFLDPLFGVSCTIDSIQAVKQAEMIDALKPGDTLTVKGRCDGMLTDVKMVGCILIPDR